MDREKLKQKLAEGEAKTDNALRKLSGFLLWLAENPYTLILVVLCALLLVIWFVWLKFA